MLASVRERPACSSFTAIASQPSDTSQPFPASGSSTPVPGLQSRRRWWMVFSFVFRSSRWVPTKVVTLQKYPLRGCPVGLLGSHLTHATNSHRSKRGSSWVIRLFRCCSVWASCCVSCTSCCSGSKVNGRVTAAAPDLLHSQKPPLIAQPT